MFQNLKKKILVRCLIGLVVFCNAAAVYALDPRKAVTQYVRNTWTSNDGLPQDSVNAIAQTTDGYLWLATQEGLARFDGVKFTTFDSSNTEKFGGFVYDILADPNGGLWIGTGGGLFNYRDGKFKRYSSDDGLPDVSMKHLVQDEAGNLWIGSASNDRTTGGHGLTFFKDERGIIFKTTDGLSNDQVHKTLIDRRGDLWIATGNGLNLYKDGKFKIFTTADGLSDNYVKTLYEDRGGSLWIGTHTGLDRLKDGRITSFTTADGLSSNFIFSICEDRDGNLWVGTEKGLNRFKDGKPQAVTGIEDLADDQIFSIYEDKEASLWIGTHTKGLIRLRDAKFTTFGEAEGLTGENVQSLFQDSRGRLWIDTTDGGLNVLENNRFENYTIKDGLLNNRIRAIYETRAGEILLGTASGLNKFENGKFVDYLPKNALSKASVNTIYEDTDGSLFVGTNVGLTVIKDGKSRNYTKADGIIGSGVNLIHRTRAGKLYIAGDDGLSIFEDGKLTSQYKGFPPEFNTQSISEDADGTLWLVTWGQGLNRLKDDNLTAYTTKNGLYDNAAWSILDDGSGYLWMGCNRGIFRVSKQELNDFADGKIKSVNSIVYGAVNGMRKRETNAGSPSAIRASDGKFWFATTAGAVVIDPHNLKNNPVAPPIVIEKLLIGDKSILPGEPNIEIEAGVKNLEFQYVGLSFISPERIKYKYKIEGFDNDWIDAGARRTAFYNNLPAGEYTFELIAANADGIWNEQAASVRFRVLAPFWQTWWFLALATLFVAGIIILMFRWRLSRLKQINNAQTVFSRRLIESQERERGRIAAELHDNLGQQLVIIKNWASLGLKFTEENAPSRKQLTEISTTALQAINEVREIIYDLRPVQLETTGLSRTLNFMIEQAAASSGVKFSVDCDDLDGFFSPEDEVVFYRAIQECVSNIIKHSEAENAEISIIRAAENLTVKVSDDGKGFAAEPVSSVGKRAGFGLTGLNERVRMLGGTLNIQSAAGNGTIVLMNIPAPSK